MTDYIKREDAKADIVWLIKDIEAKENITVVDALFGYESTEDYVDELISFRGPADVAPVVHGEWEEVERGDSLWRKCSHCHTLFLGISDARYHYCPNCGAKMDGGAHE